MGPCNPAVLPVKNLSAFGKQVLEGVKGLWKANSDGSPGGTEGGKGPGGIEGGKGQ